MKSRPQITVASLNNDSSYSLRVATEHVKSKHPGDHCHEGDISTYKYYFTAAPVLGWLLFLTALSIGVASKLFMCKDPCPALDLAN
jgi:hypothetical protein